MKATQLIMLLERGIHVEVTKKSGVIEKYHLTSDGQVVVMFSGDPSVCSYCGRHHLDRVCGCKKVLEVLSLTGAFRHLNDIAEKSGSAIYDSATNSLFLSEKGITVC
jgi:hypothetical protein